MPPTSTNQRYPGLHLSIVRTLKEYKHPIPVDYLARLYSRSKSEIEPYLNSLEENGLIMLQEKDSEIYVGLRSAA